MAILTTFSRKCDIDHVQPEEQIGAERAGLDRSVEIAMGRSDDADIHFAFPPLAQANDHPFLHDPQ